MAGTDSHPQCVGRICITIDDLRRGLDDKTRQQLTAALNIEVLQQELAKLAELAEAAELHLAAEYDQYQPECA